MSAASVFANSFGFGCCSGSGGGPGGASGCVFAQNIVVGGHLVSANVSIPLGNRTMSWFTSEVNPATDLPTGVLIPVSTTLIPVPGFGIGLAAGFSGFWKSVPAMVPFPTAACWIAGPPLQPCCWFVMTLACTGGVMVGFGPTEASLAPGAALTACNTPGDGGPTGGGIPSSGSNAPFMLQYGTPGGGVGLVFANGLLT